MITTDYCRVMARYTCWQNRSLVSAADSLDHSARWAERGAFFGSIARTFNHLLWDDALWLARFAGDERPEDHIEPLLDAPRDWETFKAVRHARDREIETWAVNLNEGDLTGEVGWYPAGGVERIAKDRALCIVHFFNHQTHHRGQIHAMLTAAGAVPDVTDLPMLERAG
ncbi:DinB family protein [Pontivivens insulae]|uniref:DinB family protein n=1 Tax=Pontivivens insulae TaxID=1639689 RepID=A0A2R8A968_9RHOB|nr:DinB family protein [Pontivivens insulae]RED12681.1 putative damage-inducible protein DinB [Pontivivens insulae]SPF28772.1 hypothetical protein POI8812_01075 [Pontivivens insulae]